MLKLRWLGIGVSIFDLWALYLGIYNCSNRYWDINLQDFLNKPINKSNMERTLIEVLYTCSKSIITNFLSSTELSLLCVPFNLNESFYQVLFQIPHETATFYNQSFIKTGHLSRHGVRNVGLLDFIHSDGFLLRCHKKTSLFVAFWQLTFVCVIHTF